MEVEITAPETGLVHTMKAQFEAPELNDKINQKLKDMSRSVRLDGFRKGKIPLSVMKQRYGKQVKQEIMFDLAFKHFFDTAKEKALKLASQPAFIDLKNPEGHVIAYEVQFEIYPEISLPELAELEIPRVSAQIKEEDVQAMIEKLRQQATEFETADKAAEEGDEVLIDFVGKINGEPFEKGSAENVPLVLGSGRMIPGFEEGIIGMKASDEKTIEVVAQPCLRRGHRFRVAVN